MSRQPNILLVLADQMTPFMLEACRGQGTQTRNLSALAARGVLFSHAYTPSPICAPARASLMTGQYMSRVGCYDNGDPFPSYIPTFAHYLTNAGYETVLSGKMHFIGADQLHGFQRRLNTDVYPSGFNWSYPLLAEGEGPESLCFNFAPQYQCGNIGPGWSTELQYDEETHMRALEYLRHAPEKPYCLTVSYTSPHPPYVAPRKYWDIYKDADMALPAYPDDMDDRYSDLDRAFLRWYGLDRADIRDPVHLMAMRRGFAALAHYVDDKLGELLEVLDETGQTENTLVIFTADHGEMLGEKGLIQKRSLYEWSVCIPLIIAGPDVINCEVETPVSLLDIPPTLLELAGAGPAESMDGRSLMPALAGKGMLPEAVISEYHGEGIMRPCFMVRKGRWKLIYIHRSKPQLFDLEEDPGEWHNKADLPEYQQILTELSHYVTQGPFDLPFIERDIWARLPQKQIVNEAMARNGTHWDYVPVNDAHVKYVRE